MAENRAGVLLGELLLSAGIITEGDLQDALRRQTASGEPLAKILVDMGAVAPRQLERALRAQARLRGRPGDDRPFVLVVDDENEVGAILAEVLEGAGYRVGVAQNGTEALAAILATDQPRPVAVVLDLVLPGRSGVEILARLRQDPETRDLAVIILSGRPDLETEVRSRDLAISGFLAKPVSARRLVEVVEAALADAPRAPATAQP